MESFECNGIEDLVFNPSFRTWVLAGQTPETEFWTEWENQNPDKTELLNYAKAIIYAMQIDFKTLTNEQVNEEVFQALKKFEH